jgi:release factor glutamine methyltransferase
MPQPYLASEDSELLRRAVSVYTGRACLEIGAGNAGAMVELSRRFEITAGTDLVEPGTTDWRDSGTSFILADMARCFRDESFDLVAFNPPYLPSKRVEDIAVDGRKDGAEVPMLFLEEALRVVKKDGRVVFLISGESPASGFESLCSRAGFGLRLLAERRIFYESLLVYEAFGLRGSR